jgi:uncharacterized lipoprotein YajG
MWRSALAAVALAALAGCASAPGVTLVAAPALPRVEGAEAVGVRVSVDDERFYKEKALVDGVQTSLEQGLAVRGFRVGQDGVRLDVAVQHVYSDREMSVWSGRKDSAEVVLRCWVTSLNAPASFSRTYSGLSGPRSGITAVQEAREAARADAVMRMLADEELLGALVSAAQAR